MFCCQDVEIFILKKKMSQRTHTFGEKNLFKIHSDAFDIYSKINIMILLLVSC